MRHATRSCAPFVLAARHQACRVGLQSLAGRSGTVALGGYRQLHLLSSRGFEKNALPGWQLSTTPKLSRPSVGAPRQLGQVQTRFIKKANYVEKIGDNESSEEFLEALDVKDDEPDTRPSPKVLDGKGEKPSTEHQDAKFSDDMTKGTRHSMPTQYSPANQTRKNAHNPIPSLQVDHSLNDS